MAKRLRAVRTMISIPADLRQRMEDLEERVNWSAVAAQAFKVRVDEIGKRTELSKWKWIKKL